MDTHTLYVHVFRPKERGKVKEKSKKGKKEETLFLYSFVSDDVTLVENTLPSLAINGRRFQNQFP